MKRNIKIIAFVGVVMLIATTIFYSCGKSELDAPDSRDENSSVNLRSDNADIMGKLNRSKHELQGRLNLIAKSLAFMMNDPAFVNLVAQNAAANGYEVRLSTLIQQCSNLPGQLDSCLDLANIPQGQMADFLTYIQSFELEGFTWYPRIWFPALNQSHFIWNGWDGKTPCYAGVSFTYLPAKVPTYKTSSGVLIEGNEDNGTAHLKPVWWVSFAHNVPIHDEFGHNREPEHSFFRQNADCKCVKTNDPNDPSPIIFCDFDNPNVTTGVCPTTTGEDGNCDGNCEQPTSPVTLLSCEFQ